ncbi:MAG: carbon-nitrogen hydrolase [Colwellia sp.]|nr:carbon-nitrogen hydrolase [Colwellia sp.]
MRVAVCQFATSLDVQENLATCIRMINEAAACKPAVLVLPEFCNTLFCHARPWYVDHNQAWHEALSIDGDFLHAIAAQAKKHDCYIVVNVTLQRDLCRDHQDGTIKSNISVTSCLFSPIGKIIQQMDQDTLTGHENDFFISASSVAEVVTTPFGKLGLLAGSDSMTFAAPRRLALSGAHLLCNSINTFAIDQSNLHDPAGACENRVFIATANKVGSLVPDNKLQAKIFNETLSAPSTVSQEFFMAVGQSQIVSPDGKVLAKLTTNEEGYIFADIDVSGTEIGFNNKLRPDGTELIQQRRPELYQELTAAIKQKASTNKTVSINKVFQHEQALEHNSQVATTANVAIFATYKSNEQAIEDVCHYIENNLSDIIQLPELFFVADKTITNDAKQLAQIAELSKQLIDQVSSVLRPFQYLCTSLVIEGIHQAVLISEHGLLATQQQLHFCKRYQWTALGDQLNIIELPLEQGSISLAMLTADDANIPEIVKVAALSDIHLLLVPFDIQEACEVEYSLLSRAAENRICIVAASREKSFANDLPSENANNNTANNNKIKAHKSTGLIANLTTDFAFLPQWQAPKFTGYINQPLVKYQYGKITKAVIHPFAADNKLMAKIK